MLTSQCTHTNLEIFSDAIRVQYYRRTPYPSGSGFFSHTCTIFFPFYHSFTTSRPTTLFPLDHNFRVDIPQVHTIRFQIISGSSATLQFPLIPYFHSTLAPLNDYTQHMILTTPLHSTPQNTVFTSSLLPPSTTSQCFLSLSKPEYTQLVATHHHY